MVQIRTLTEPQKINLDTIFKWLYYWFVCISAYIPQFSYQLLDELVAHLFKNKNNPRSGFNSSLFSSTFDTLKVFCVNCEYVLKSSGPSVVSKVYVSRVNKYPEMPDYFLANRHNSHCY